MKLNLRKTSDDSETLRSAFKLAAKEIEEVLGHKKPNTDITRLASNTASTYGKIKSAEIHDKALELLIIRFQKDPKMIEE